MINNPLSAVLYVGVTGDLTHRVWQHKNKLIPEFTSRYNLTRLVFYECFFYPDAAIAREKEIKGWRGETALRKCFSEKTAGTPSASQAAC